MKQPNLPETDERVSTLLKNLPSSLPGTPHTHVDKNGILIECYHSTKGVLTSASFWIGVTISFPIEHLLWTTWPLSVVGSWFGL